MTSSVATSSANARTSLPNVQSLAPTNRALSSSKSASNSSGWLGGLLEKIIPPSNEMKLPNDDKIPENEKVFNYIFYQTNFYLDSMGSG